MFCQCPFLSFFLTPKLRSPKRPSNVYVSSFQYRFTRKILSDISPTVPDFTESEKCETWLQFSTPVEFKAL